MLILRDEHPYLPPQLDIVAARLIEERSAASGPLQRCMEEVLGPAAKVPAS